MIRRLACAVAVLALAPSAAWCQVEGWNLDGGVVWLTRSGKLRIGSSVFESDTGRAVRGRLKRGFGWVAVGADVQTSSQKFGGTAPDTAPESLSATFVGLSATAHPVTLMGLTPYGEVGLGRLFFTDERIDEGGGVGATSYGVGLRLGLGPRLKVDTSFRILRQSGLRVEGVADELKYDPKLFSLMLSLQL
jgi:hypothetical protein